MYKRKSLSALIELRYLNYSLAIIHDDVTDYILSIQRFASFWI